MTHVSSIQAHTHNTHTQPHVRACVHTQNTKPLISTTLLLSHVYPVHGALTQA